VRVLIALLALSTLLLAEVHIGTTPQRVADRFVPKPKDLQVTTWAKGLRVPWSLLFLPDNHALVSERSGAIRLIDPDGRLHEEPLITLPVHSDGEGGLMGLALHPDYPQKPWLYAMHTHREAGLITNRVVRLAIKGDRARFDRVILGGIPGGRFHNGGRIAFGPDGLLYITTGETFKRAIAQDRGSLGGKILRIDENGQIPGQNPFGGALYSLGHRNPQGLAWHPESGALFSSEHGPSGEMNLRAFDEINVIHKGGNYGWPEAVGAVDSDRFIDPIISWPDASVPPAGMAFWQGSLYMATLRSQALLRVKLERQGDRYQAVAIDRLFATDEHTGRYGRLRDVTVGPDGALYLLTSNRDGRGDPRPGDDRILRIAPQPDPR
jgi:quinoprotein glucose dehydrogenase